jgi:hypothetical protein
VLVLVLLELLMLLSHSGASVVKGEGSTRSPARVLVVLLLVGVVVMAVLMAIGGFEGEEEEEEECRGERERRDAGEERKHDDGVGTCVVVDGEEEVE